MALRPAVRSLNNSAERPAVPDSTVFSQHAGTVSTPEPMTETYGVLTVGAVNSGTVALGQKVTGAGVLPQTAIDGQSERQRPRKHLDCQQRPNGRGRPDNDGDSPPSPKTVSFVGGTENNDFFDVQPNGSFGFDNNPSSLSYMSGTAAAALGLTQASGAIHFIAGRPAPDDGTIPEQHRSERQSEASSSVRFRPPKARISHGSGGLGSVD